MGFELEPLESEKDSEGKAVFGERRPQQYSGPERRGYIRRVLCDRRAAVRFEPDKPDRRAGLDRRTRGNWSNAYSL
ncbi:MAG: hypothetical protein R3E62_07200 [Pseudomonadales bacterium]|jgi:hypothetical protein